MYKFTKTEPFEREKVLPKNEIKKSVPLQKMETAEKTRKRKGKSTPEQGPKTKKKSTASSSDKNIEKTPSKSIGTTQIKKINQDPTKSLVDTILLFGSSGTGKSTFAKHLAKQREHFEIKESRITSEKSNSSSAPRIDFIIFFIDITNKNSFEEIRKHLDSEDFDFSYSLFRKSSIIISHVEKPSKYAFSIEELEILSQKHNIPISYVNLQNQNDATILAKKIARQVDIATQKTIANSLVVSAVTVSLEADTLV